MRYAITLLAIAAVANIAQAEEEILTAREWHASIQAVGAKYKKGQTKAQTNLARKNLFAETAALPAVKVRMSSTVKDVRWKDGVAEVYANSFLDRTDINNAKTPLRVSRHRPFEFLMDEETAASIEPGTEIGFMGTLDFHATRHGAVGRAVKAQQMHTLYHPKVTPYPLGTYTSSDCHITIGGNAICFTMGDTGTLTIVVASGESAFLSSSAERVSAMKFDVATEGGDKLGLAEICQRHANELWVPAHLDAEQAAAFVLDHFRRAVLQELEMLSVNAEQ